MRTVAVLQARTTSSRFPGKALQPVAGYPSAVLAALRAGNRGIEVLAATSSDPSDDELTSAFARRGVPVFRGPLADVLGRYAQAIADLAGDTITVRLTGDNLFPDGDFIAQLASAYKAAGVEYMTANPPGSPLPYGLSAEAFSAAVLRQAHESAQNGADREHVTPWMIRNCNNGAFTPLDLGNADYGHLRCTIDDQEDYERVQRVFAGMADPIQAGWRELADKLAELPGAPRFRVPFRVHCGRVHSQLTLGTAQLGMEYGIANRTGQPSRAVAVALIRRAIAHGVTQLDTARSYGDSEAVVGEALGGAWRSRTQVITKLDPLESLSADAGPLAVGSAVDESVAASCRALGVDHLPVLLLHRREHRKAWNGVAWQRLLELRASGTIGMLGVSVYDPEEALEALQDPDVQHLQLPMNLLDWRWRAKGVPPAVSSRPDVVVHARSAFLQGLLLSPPELWPETDYEREACLRTLGELVRRFGRDGVADLCLAYLRAQPWITSVVVGCETLAQLDQNLDLSRRQALTEEQCEEVVHSLPTAPEALLNPAKWKIAHAQPAA